MALVIDALLAFVILIGGVWIWTLRGSVYRDSVAAGKRAAEARRKRERDARDAKVYRTGEPLRCLGCDTSFSGPLTETGCPRCHLSALVVTEDDWRQGQNASQSLGSGE